MSALTAEAEPTAAPLPGGIKVAARTDLEEMGRRAVEASRALCLATGRARDAVLAEIADELERSAAGIERANAADVEKARAAGLPPALLDRLRLSTERIAGMVEGVRRLVRLPDPVGQREDEQVLPSGLRIARQRVPFGVVAMIYEARPEVTVEAATICLKSGNAALLRGGTECRGTNEALTGIVRGALGGCGLPEDAVQSILDPDRALVRQMVKLDRYVDVLIPRGGAALNAFCRQHATMPAITGGGGVCHLYVDRSADQDAAVPLVIGDKVRQPTACNTLETLLVDRPVAAEFLPRMAAALHAEGVELRVDEDALAALAAAGVEGEWIVPARPSDFGTEFMAKILSVRVVDGVRGAVEHIRRYGTGHTEGVLAEDPAVRDLFLRAVDAAAVVTNASLRFHDAWQLQLGAEIAISTQKLHVRGPVPPAGLTTHRWVVEGEGHVRQ